MYGESRLSKKLVKALEGTRHKLRDVCEDLGIDYEELMEGELPIDNCSHCGIWSTRLIPDLDNNPICKTCVEHVGM